MALPLSFLTNDHVIHVYVHIPLVARQSYNLFQIVDAPLRDEQGRTVRLEYGKKYLAVDTNESEFIELTQEEFASCTRTAGAHVCPLGVLAKDPASGCLASLYVNHEALPNLCHFRSTVEAKEVVTQVAPDQVIINAPSGHPKIVANLNCPGAAGDAGLKQLAIFGAGRITVPDGCILSTANFAFRPTLQGGLSASFVTRILRWEDVNAMLSAAHNEPAMDADIANLTAAVDRTIPLGELHPLEEVATHSSVVGNIVGALGVIIFLVLAAAAVYLIFRWETRNKQRAERREQERAARELRQLAAQQPPQGGSSV